MLEELRKKIEAHVGTSVQRLEKVNGGASSRRYYLAYLADPAYFPTDQVLTMVVPLEEITILLDYMNVDYYLRRHNIPTPRIYEVWQEAGIIFLEYIYWPRLDLFLNAHPQELEKYIPAAVQFIQEMQHKAAYEAHCPAFQRRFDFDKFMFEFQFHVRQHLIEGYFGRSLNSRENAQFQQFAEFVSRTLDSPSQFFVHRDFQTSNMFATTGNGAIQFRIIDFQDARTGSPIYDLVSLLWDSYIPVSPHLRQQCLEQFYQYLQSHNLKWSKEEFHFQVDLMVIQRKLHDAGAFARNHHRFGSMQYVPYIQPAIEMALAAMEKHALFKPMVHLFRQLIEDHRGH